MTTRVDGASGRYYVVEGEKYPSVTSVLNIIAKPQLVPWAAKTAAEAFAELILANEVGDFGELIAFERARLPEFVKMAKAAPRKRMTDAADIGSRVHEYIECWTSGADLPPVTDDMRPSLDAYDQWVEEHGITIMESEQVVWSDAWRFAGTLDAIGQDRDGNRVVLDWKTSSAIHDEYMMQVAAYVVADEERTGLRAAEAHIVRFPKDGKGVEVKTLDASAISEQFSGFISALSLWRFRNEQKEK